MRALRILCLHGFRSSGMGLKAQMQGLVSGLRTQVEFIYVDAPPLASGGHAWWNATPIAGADGRAKRYEGWAEARAWAISFFDQSGPVDGVFGFSQGAALTALLVGMRSPDGAATSEQPLQFGCAVLVSGFVSQDPAHAALYRARASFALPSLHVIGRSDRVVPPEASLALATRFEAPTVVEHEGGHVIANSEPVRQAMATFFGERSAQTR
jgi:predicted esterase